MPATIKTVREIQKMKKRLLRRLNFKGTFLLIFITGSRHARPPDMTQKIKAHCFSIIHLTYHVPVWHDSGVHGMVSGEGSRNYCLITASNSLEEVCRIDPVTPEGRSSCAHGQLFGTFNHLRHVHPAIENLAKNNKPKSRSLIQQKWPYQFKIDHSAVINCSISSVFSRKVLFLEKWWKESADFGTVYDLVQSHEVQIDATPDLLDLTPTCYNDHFRVVFAVTAICLQRT